MLHKEGRYHKNLFLSNHLCQQCKFVQGKDQLDNILRDHLYNRREFHKVALLSKPQGSRLCQKNRIEHCLSKRRIQNYRSTQFSSSHRFVFLLSKPLKCTVPNCSILSDLSSLRFRQFLCTHQPSKLNQLGKYGEPRIGYH
jgi:hypothetical protein